MNAWLTRTRKRLTGFWSWLRQVSEDDAYERCSAALGRDPNHQTMTAADFYLQHLERKYSRPSRCC